jgi:hypothetical protein
MKPVMGSPSAGDERRSRIQLQLSDLLFSIAVLALVLSIAAPAVRSGKEAAWAALTICTALFALIAAPVLLLGFVVILAPTTLAPERARAAFVVKSILVLILIIFSYMINHF